MKNKEYQFEFFYYKPETRILKFDSKVEEMRINKLYSEKYSEKIFCPDCIVAPLTFVNRENAQHLRSKRLEYHLEYCSYRYECANNDMIKKYLEKLDEDNLRGKLQSAIRLLVKRNNSTIIENEIIQLEEVPNLIIDRTNTIETIHTIRKKSLNTSFNSDMEGYYLFYGEVKLKSEKRKGKYSEFYSLDIFTKNKSDNWSKKASIVRKNYNDLVEDDKIYYIAVFGEYELKNGFSNISIKSNKQLLIIDRDTDEKVENSFVNFEKNYNCDSNIKTVKEVHNEDVKGRSNITEHKAIIKNLEVLIENKNVDLKENNELILRTAIVQESDMLNHDKNVDFIVMQDDFLSISNSKNEKSLFGINIIKTILNFIRG